MDPITHALAGAMVARSIEPTPDQSQRGRLWFWSVVIAAELPDLDVLFYLLPNPPSLAFYHRGFTHSFFWALVFSLAGAKLFQRWFGGGFRRHWAALALAFGSHVLGDWATSYGTPLLLPFSSKIFALDYLSNLTFAPMAIFVVALFMASRRGPVWIKTGWAACLLFVALSAAWHRQALHLAGPQAAAALPALADAPSVWHMIERTSPLSYETETVSVWTHSERSTRIYPSLESCRGDAAVAQALADPKARAFLWFNRWPVARVKEEDGKKVVELGNLLFRWKKDGRVGGLRLELDGQGRVAATRRILFAPEPRVQPQ